MPSTSSWEAERHCREHVDGLGRPSCQPGNCQKNTRHIRLYLCGSYQDRVNPSKRKSQLTTPFTCGSALQPGQEAKLPQGASLCNELLTPADTQRDRKRPQTKQFPASLTFPTWKGCSVRSGSYQDRYLGTSYHIYPALEYPLRMLTDSFPPPCVQGIIHCPPSPRHTVSTSPTGLPALSPLRKHPDPVHFL